MNVPESNLKRVVIVGAGFAGLRLAQSLREKQFQVVLLDKNNYHTFQPLLYQVATAGLEADSIAHSIRTIFHQKSNFFFRIAKVKSIDKKECVVRTDIGSLSYDYLVVSTGSKTNYYGNANVERYAYPMKSVLEALDLRSLILQNFESAILTIDLEKREQLMNFVIVGGGPTGVELAGALAELKNHVLPNDYPDLDIRKMNIHLIDATSRLLNGMSEESAKKAKEYLDELGVQIWFDTLVKDYNGATVLTNKKNHQTQTLIWAAGVQGNIIPGLANEAVEHSRYLCNAFNQIEGYDNVFALGDCALVRTKDKPMGDPMVAQVAIQQGELLSRNLSKINQGKEMSPFRYKDKGSMATIGRNKAVVDLPGMKFSGFFAWIVWMFVHLVSLVGFRNKIVALANWILQYVSYDKHVRLIIRPVKRKTIEEVTSFKDL